jgi:hypothetical protein
LLLIKVHLKNGRTLSYDLQDSEQASKWVSDSREINFQSQITGIGIVFNSQWFALPLPKKFRQFHFEASLIESKKNTGPRFKGEKVQCFADDVLASIVVYWGQKPKMSKFDVVRIGRRRFNPGLKTG